MGKKNNEALFQERVDELLLLEEQSSRRGEQFIQLVRDHREKSQESLDDLLMQVRGVSEHLHDRLSDVGAAAQQLNDAIAQNKQSERRAVSLFLRALASVVVTVSSTLWWSHHINGGLAQAKQDLAGLTTTLQHTPKILTIRGQDFVRVVPDSETGFTRGDGSDVDGRYARVWPAR